jgi:Na+-translocating ferredoxin:NAD+ oxidoreductase RnfD subunit
MISPHTQHLTVALIVEAAWLCPWESQLHWMIPVAFIVCLLVAFFLSLLIEFPILKMFYKDKDKATVWKATFIANALSYMILVPLSLVYLWIASN